MQSSMIGRSLDMSRLQLAQRNMMLAQSAAGGGGGYSMSSGYAPTMYTGYYPPMMPSYGYLPGMGMGLNAGLNFGIGFRL